MSQPDVCRSSATACVYVALLRGINVGRNKRIAMADLRELITTLGHRDARTYVNSGNVIFHSNPAPNADIARDIHDAIQDQFGMSIDVVVRSGDELRRIVADNPFSERASAPKTLHVAFLSGVPDPEEVARLADLPRGEDEYRVVGDNIYLSYPNLLTGSVFQPRLNVVQTSRNWSTVIKLTAMTSDEKG